MRLNRLLPIGALVISLFPATAGADWLLTPFLGGVFGGNANFGDFNNFDDEAEQRLTFGASLGWMGAGIIGAEVDFGYSPNFFEDTRGTGDFQFGDSNVTTLMGNVIIGAPVGGQQGLGIRPYGSGGLGLIRTHIEGTRLLSDLNANDLGVNIGGGVIGFFSDNFGLRGDVRYFRSLQDNEADGDLDLSFGNFDFWRATVGATFRW